MKRGADLRGRAVDRLGQVLIHSLPVAPGRIRSVQARLDGVCGQQVLELALGAGQGPSLERQ
ncbi:hypothetical protein GCM10009670_10200 [Citricoccus alkalitolerans]